MNDAMLRAACDAERAHDGASPCHFCPEQCSNDALAAAIRVALGEAVAENERLRAKAQNDAREMLAAVENAEAETARLQAALEKIAGLTMSMCLSVSDLAQRQKDIAFEALGVRHD